MIKPLRLVNKANMTYINGILKNWRKEGYPKDDVGGNEQWGKHNGKGNEQIKMNLKDSNQRNHENLQKRKEKS